MTNRTSTGRFLLRWWPAPFSIGMAAYALLVPEPYALGSSKGETLAFLCAAVLLTASAIFPSRSLRLTALWWAMVIALGRSAVLVFNPPVVDARRTAAGVVVWLMFAYLVTMLTLISELSAGPRRSRSWGH
jgi:hypothetical protein